MNKQAVSLVCLGLLVLFAHSAIAASNLNTVPTARECAKVYKGTSGLVEVKNVCSYRITVSYCVLPKPGDNSDGAKYFDCRKGDLGSPFDLPPGTHEGLAVGKWVSPILTFPCPSPQGMLDLGAGVGKKVPIKSSGHTYYCRVLPPAEPARQYAPSPSAPQRYDYPPPQPVPDPGNRPGGGRVSG